MKQQNATHIKKLIDTQNKLAVQLSSIALVTSITGNKELEELLKGFSQNSFSTARVLELILLDELDNDCTCVC